MNEDIIKINTRTKLPHSQRTPLTGGECGKSDADNKVVNLTEFKKDEDYCGN
jgi:hypothetical protein